MRVRQVVSLVLLLLIAATTRARDGREQRRIEYLLHAVGSLPDSKFIRNGFEYDPATAERHLRGKLESVGEKLTTAEQFIEYCATKSSMSGKPYLIKHANGKTVEVASFLTARLAEFDKIRQ